MPNLKFDFFRHICAAVVVNASPLGGVPYLCGLTYLSKLARGDMGATPTTSPTFITRFFTFLTPQS